MEATNPERIVLVEDSPVQAMQTRLILESVGYQVQICPNGTMALALISEHQPDLILLDLHLPDIQGQEIARRIKSDPTLSGIPIIFLTGVFREVQDVIQGLAQGADDYIDKAVEAEELIARVQASLRAKKTQRELGRLARLLLLVSQVGSQLAGLLNPLTLPNAVVQLVHENFEYPYVQLYLQEKDSLILAAAVGADTLDWSKHMVRVYLTDDYGITQAVNQGQLVIMNAEANQFLPHPFLKQIGALVAVPLRSGGKVTGVIEIASPQAGVMNANDGLVMRTLADMTGMALHNSRLYQSMEELATYDSLTGLLNRRTILNSLEEEWMRARRYQRMLAIVALDVDKFKQINDMYGHATGDHALQAVANLIRHVIRNVDLVGRLGGDEFLLVLPETDVRGANDVAERIRAECSQWKFRIEQGIEISFTLSIGVAGWPQIAVASLNELIACADRALYESKENGRNQVSIYRTEKKEASG